MAFIPPIIMLLSGGLAYFFAKRKKYILLRVLLGVVIIFFGMFMGFTLGYFLADAGESVERAGRAISSGLVFSIVGVFVGNIYGRKFSKNREQ